MSKIRIYELAKLLGKSNKELMEILHSLDVEVKSHMSSIDTETAQLVEDTVLEAGKPSVVKEHQKEEETLAVPMESTVSDVAGILGVSPGGAVNTLIQDGMMVPANAPVDESILRSLSHAFGKKLVQSAESKKGPEEESTEATPAKTLKERPSGEHLGPRPPIVTVMGHVDHGKTTLLDYIRETKVADAEAGGITQHIGASVVQHEGGTIVFLDTPGHEAFTEMRSRGAQVTDIAILVVAAEDGLMPQSVEAINHAKAAGVPIVVAINKIDKPEANPDRVRQQLSEHKLIPEEWGGNTIMIEVSAKKGIGVDQLLEMVTLTAEMEELKADPTVDPKGVFIEARLDKGKGAVGTVIVQEGTLMRGDIILAETTWARIRAMISDTGAPVDTAGPSTPVEILGLNGVPHAGERFHKVAHEKDARDAVNRMQQEKREQQVVKANKPTLEQIYEQMREGSIPQLNLVIKADVQGSLEALKGSIQKLPTEEVGLNIIHEGVGRLSGSDIQLASVSDAIVIGFNVRPDSNAKKLAEKEGVQVRLYRVIYDLIEDVRSALEGMLAPTVREHIIGEAEIRAVFKVPKAGKVAGCYVTNGSIRRNAKVRIVRDGVVTWDGSLSALKRFKDDVREVAQGYECGMDFANFQDIREGDVVEAYEMIEEKRNLE